MNNIYSLNNLEDVNKLESKLGFKVLKQKTANEIIVVERKEGTFELHLTEKADLDTLTSKFKKIINSISLNNIVEKVLDFSDVDSNISISNTDVKKVICSNLTNEITSSKVEKVVGKNSILKLNDVKEVFLSGHFKEIVFSSYDLKVTFDDEVIIEKVVTTKNSYTEFSNIDVLKRNCPVVAFYGDYSPKIASNEINLDFSFVVSGEKNKNRFTSIKDLFCTKELNKKFFINLKRKCPDMFYDSENKKFDNDDYVLSNFAEILKENKYLMKASLNMDEINMNNLKTTNSLVYISDLICKVKENVDYKKEMSRITEKLKILKEVFYKIENITFDIKEKNELDCFKDLPVSFSDFITVNANKINKIIIDKNPELSSKIRLKVKSDTLIRTQNKKLVNLESLGEVLIEGLDLESVENCSGLKVKIVNTIKEKIELMGCRFKSIILNGEEYAKKEVKFRYCNFDLGFLNLNGNIELYKCTNFLEKGLIKLASSKEKINVTGSNDNFIVLY